VKGYFFELAKQSLSCYSDENQAAGFVYLKILSNFVTH